MRAALVLLMCMVGVCHADEAADFEDGRKMGHAVSTVLSTERLVDTLTDSCGSWYQNQAEMARDNKAGWHTRNDELVQKAQALRKQMLVVNAKAQGKEGDLEFEKDFETMVQTAIDTPANTKLAQFSALDKNPKFINCLQFVAQVGGGQLDIQKLHPTDFQYLQSMARGK